MEQTPLRLSRLTTTGKAEFFQLPVELEIYLFSFLQPKDLYCVSLTCKRWNSLYLSESIWAFLFESNFFDYINYCPPKLLTWKDKYQHIASLEKNWSQGNYNEYTFNHHADRQAFSLKFTKDYIVYGCGKSVAIVAFAQNFPLIHMDRNIGKITDLDFTDDNLLAIANSEGCVEFRNLSKVLSNEESYNSVPIIRFENLFSWVECCKIIKYNSSTKILASYNEGGFTMWDVESEKSETVFGEHTRNTVDLKFVSDHYVISGSFDGKAKLWDLRDPQQSVLTMQEGTSVKKVDAINSHFLPQTVFVGSAAGTIGVWDLRQIQKVKTITHGKNDISSMKLKNEKMLISGGRDKILKIWDLTDWNNIQVIKRNVYTDWVTSITTNTSHLLFCTNQAHVFDFQKSSY